MSESIGVSFDGKGINMSVSFEKGVSTEVEFPQGANVDLSGVAQEQTLLDKAEEIKQAVENAKPKIDTTELAKQGDDPEATNTAIYNAVKSITSLDSDITAGKESIARAITNKGIPAYASDSLLAMSEKIENIKQEPIIVEETKLGTVLFPKDAYNVIEEASRYQNGAYAGLVLVELYSTNETIQLSGADAYYTSDGYFYTTATTHTWSADENKINRYVIYYFANSDTTFTIHDAISTAVSITIIGTIGAIRSSIACNISKVYNLGTIGDMSFDAATTFDATTYIKIKEHTHGNLLFNNNNSTNIIIDVEKISGGSIVYGNTQTGYGVLKSILFPSLKEVSGGDVVKMIASHIAPNVDCISFPKVETLSNNSTLLTTNDYNPHLANLSKIEFPLLRSINNSGVINLSNNVNALTNIQSIEFPSLEEVYTNTRVYDSRCLLFGTSSASLLNVTELTFPSLKKIHFENNNNYSYFMLGTCIKKLHFPKLEILSITRGVSRLINNMSKLEYLYLGYDTNDRNNSILIQPNTTPNLTDIELKEGYLKPLDVADCKSLTADNIVNHMFAKLGVNTGDPITLTLGSTNLAKLTDEQKQIAIDKGWTLA